MSHTTYEAPYVLAAQSWRRTTPSSPWHIMRVGETTPAPMMLGLCGTETQAPQHAEVVRAGYSPLGGRLCDRCRKLYNRGGAYEAQGPCPDRPENMDGGVLVCTNCGAEDGSPGKCENCGQTFLAEPISVEP